MEWTIDEKMKSQIQCFLEENMCFSRERYLKIQKMIKNRKKEKMKNGNQKSQKLKKHKKY